MRREFPNWEFNGVDVDKELINFARERNFESYFYEMNFFQIKNINKIFDIVLAIQFVPSVDFDLKDFIEVAKDISKNYVILTGLFSEGWIEQHTIAHDLNNKWQGIYKIYSLERLKQLAKENGFSDVYFERFEIDIELPKPDFPRFGTYTERTIDGRLLQISGYMLMPWYNVLLKK